MTKPIRVIQGGQGAGKNRAIALLWLLDAQRGERFLGTIMTDTYDNLRDGAMLDFEKTFDAMGLNFFNYYNGQKKEIRYKKARIQFRYISDNRSTGKSKRRDRLYINEGNKIGWEVAWTYISRSTITWIDFNPDFEFWAHTQLPHIKDKDGVSLTENIIVTYQHNELIPATELDFILARKDNVEWFRVYGEGLTGTYSSRRIYNYQLIDEVPEQVKRVASGMDFGASPAPTSLVDAYIEGANLYLDLVFEENNLEARKIEGSERMAIVDKLEEVRFEKNWLIIADSAGRNEIKDIREHGWNIVGVKKRAGSIINGIKLLRSYNIFVTKRSTQIYKAMDNWFWKIDKNGKIVPEPDGHEPDSLAAARYIFVGKAQWE